LRRRDYVAVRRQAREIVVQPGDVLIYRDKAVGTDVLDAVLDTDRRLLWAFVSNEAGDVIAVCYSEDHVIWLSDSDVQAEKDVEV